MDIKKPSCLGIGIQVKALRSLALVAPAVGGDSSLESSVEREKSRGRGGTRDVKSRRVDTAIGAECAAAVGEKAGTLATGG